MNKNEMLKVGETPKGKPEKDQIVILGFIICIILICILTAYTVINTKTLDKLVTRVENLENGTYSGNGNNGSEEPQEATGYSTEDFKEIKPSDIKSESKNKTIVVLWARQSCGYCVAYAPIITEVAKEHNVTIRYINMESIVDMSTWEPSNQEEYDILANLEGEGQFKTFAKEAIEGTPGTYFIKNNKIINGIIGYVEKDRLEQSFKEAGL